MSRVQLCITIGDNTFTFKNCDMRHPRVVELLHLAEARATEIAITVPDNDKAKTALFGLLEGDATVIETRQVATPEMLDALSTRIEDLRGKVTTRTLFTCCNAGLTYVWQVAELDRKSYLEKRGFGPGGYLEFSELFASMGISFGMDLSAIVNQLPASDYP